MSGCVRNYSYEIFCLVLFAFLIILTNIPKDQIILRPIPFEVLSGAPAH